MMKNNVLKSLATSSRQLFVALAACTLVTLGGCAAMGNSSPEAQVTQRANARWQALIANKIDKAYALTTPSFRNLVDLETYRGRNGGAVKWEAADVVSVECPEPDRCKSKIRIDVKPLIARGSANRFSTFIDENWVLENGQWWYSQPIDAK